MENQLFIIRGDLAQAILNYLATRPSGEVHHLVNGLVNIQPLAPVPQKEASNENAEPSDPVHPFPPPGEA